VVAVSLKAASDWLNLAEPRITFGPFQGADLPKIEHGHC